MQPAHRWRASVRNGSGGQGSAKRAGTLGRALSSGTLGRAEWWQLEADPYNWDTERILGRMGDSTTGPRDRQGVEKRSPYPCFGHPLREGSHSPDALCIPLSINEHQASNLKAQHSRDGRAVLMGRLPRAPSQPPGVHVETAATRALRAASSSAFQPWMQACATPETVGAGNRRVQARARGLHLNQTYILWPVPQSRAPP